MMRLLQLSTVSALASYLATTSVDANINNHNTITIQDSMENMDNVSNPKDGHFDLSGVFDDDKIMTE